MSSETRARDGAGVVLLVLLSVPINFWDLGRYGPSNMDELFYHYVSRHMLESGNFLRLEFTGEHRLYDTFLNAPLYYWAKALVIAVLGDGWLAMRLISAACGLGAVLMCWHLVRRIASPGAALLAGLVQLTTFQFIYLHSARTGEMETAIALLVILCAHLFLRALIHGGSFWAHHLCLVALAHLKLPLAAPPLMAELAWFALDRASRERFREWLRAGVWLLPVALVWRVGQAAAHWDGFVAITSKMLAQASGEDSLVAQRHGGALGNLLYYGRTLLFGAYPWSLVYPLAVFGLLARVRGGTDARSWRLLGFYLAAIAGFFLLVSKHFPWYVISAYPILSAFTGVWLWHVWREGPRPAELAGLGVALAVAIWLRMPWFAYDPFSYASARLAPQLFWGAPLEIPAWWGLPLFSVVFGLAGARWLRRSASRRPGAGLVALLAGAALLSAGARVVGPLRFTDYQAPLELLRDELDAARSRGEPLPYPVEYVKGAREPGLVKIRYFFGDEFWIVPVREPDGSRTRVVNLYERSRGTPPRNAARPGGGQG